jgi:hypothetical protein
VLVTAEGGMWKVELSLESFPKKELGDYPLMNCSLNEVEERDELLLWCRRIFLISSGLLLLVLSLLLLLLPLLLLLCTN